MQIESPHMTSYLMAIAMFALSVKINEIFINEIQCQKFDIEHESQDQDEGCMHQG